MAWRVARALLQNSAAAEDAVQDAWLDVWRNLSSFDAGRPFKPWLLTIVANRCRMALRRSAPLTTTLVEIRPESVSLADDLTDTFVRGETDADLTAALATLPPDRLRLIEFRFFAQLDISEIALVLGIAEGTVKSRLHRTLATLRTRLQGAGIEAR